MDAPVVRNILEASKPDKVNPNIKKTPLTSTIIKKIIEKHASPNANLQNLSIGFVGFLRYNELTSMTTNNIQFPNTILVL